MMASSPSAAKVKEYESIYLGGKSHLTLGKLRIAQAGMGWKSAKTGNVMTVAAGDLKRAQWLSVAKGHELRLQLKNGNVVKFDGFPADTQDELKRTLRGYYGVELETKELSVRGWNWGQTEFQGNAVFFNVGNRLMFELPMNEVSNTSMATKTEVSLEFKLPSAEEVAADKDVLKDDQLVEMRFFLPGGIQKSKQTNSKDSEENEGENDKEAEDEMEVDEEETTAAQQFFNVIKTKADLGVVVGNSITAFHELFFITPRGRYEVELFQDFMRMHGKSYDYKILYSSIKRLFLLPKPDEIHVMFVMELDPPIRQGQTRYPYLVVQFVRDEDVEATIHLSETELAEQFQGRLKPSYDGASYEVVSTVFSIMTQVDLTTPQSFKSHYGSAGLKCSIKVNEGFIYMLEDAFLFVPKPTTHMPYAQVSTVIFSRMSGAASRTFDMKIVMRKGMDYTFSNLNKEEHPMLEAFLLSKRVKVKNEMGAEEAALRDLASSSDEETGAPRKAGDDDDEDESDDEDYVAEQSDSDVPEEFDEDYASSGDSDADAGEGGENEEEEEDEEEEDAE